jgi:glutamate--cysteine ligase
MRFIDVFLLHCLLSDSPNDTPQEIAELKHNQHQTAARGREPGLKLKRGGQEVTLTGWGAEVLAQCAPIAAALDAAHGGTQYADTLTAASAALLDPSTLPSARVLAAMAGEHDNSFVRFARAQSLKTQAALQAQPLSADELAHFAALTEISIQEQKKIEASDTMPFEVYRQQYVSAERLGMPGREAVAI